MRTPHSFAAQGTETPTALLIRIGQDGRVAHFNPGLHQLLIEHPEQAPEKIDLGFSGSRLLERLLVIAGDVVSREELIAYAWPERVVGQGSLNQQIYTLRQILGDEKDREIIQTLPRRGYLFNPSYLINQPPPAPLPEACAKPLPATRPPRNLRLSLSCAVLLVAASGMWLNSLKTADTQAQVIEQLHVWLLETDPQLREQMLARTTPLLKRMAKLKDAPAELAISQAAGFYHVHCMQGASSHTLSVHSAQLEHISDQQLRECLR